MSLQVLVNGFDIANGITHRINWVETTGLFDPVALVAPEAVDTFDGPFRVRQTTVDFGSREISISGILLVAASSYADKLRALDGLQAIYAARPSRVVVGTLELLVDFDRVQVAADQLKRLNGMIKYTVTGTAIPSTFACSHGNGAGQLQGIPVDTQRVNEAAILATMASGVGTITNPGDVPTPAVLTIQGAASTVYYLATSATGRRVPIATDANGVGRIDERAGLYLTPGVNRITAYQAATGTATFTDITVMSFFGTTWRYSGNAASGTATRFDLGPALTVNRTGVARYFRGNTNPTAGGTDGIVTAGDDEPRIGWVWQNRRNLFTPSQDLFATSWTISNVNRTSGGAVEPFGFTGAGGVITLNATTTGAGRNSQYVVGGLSTISYVVSVYILKDSVTARQAGIQVNTSTQFGAALLNTSTGVAQRSTDSTLTCTVSVVDSGLWWRLAITWTGDATQNNVRLYPALAVGGATATTSLVTGSAVFACPQVEIGTTPTAYQATDANGISLDHPVNDSGLVLEGTATNVCLASEDYGTAPWILTGLTGVSINAAVSPSGTTTADRITDGGSGSGAYQIIVSLSTSTNYTFSIWIKKTSGTSVVTLNVQSVSGGLPTGTDVFTPVSATVGTNWTRLSISGGSGANTSLAFLFSSTGNIEVWGGQVEAGTAATSYIPTTTVSATRLADVAGLTSPHNLLRYSDQFDNAAWVKGSRITVTGNAEVGPDGIQNADRVVLAAGAGTASFDDIRLAVPSGTYEIGKVYTLSCWVKTITGSPASMRLFLNGAGPTPLTFVPTTTWQRYSASYVPSSAASDGWTIDFNNNTSGFTVAIYGAQLTEGYLPGRYIRTTDTNVLPVQMIDPSWSQNGYIEADFLWEYNASISTAQYMFGDSTGTASGAIRLDVGGLSTNTMRFLRYYAVGTQVSVSFTDAPFSTGESGRVRMEWTNFLLGGSRYMYLRIYTITGGITTLRSETNFAGTVGSSWSALDVTRLSRIGSGGGWQGTISNLVIGTPSLPEGSQAAGI